MTDLEHKENKKKAAISIKKVKGLTEKVLTMVESDEYCPDIIQQIDAIKGLLDSAKKTLLLGHLDHCLVEQYQLDKKRAMKELLRIFDLNK